MALRDVEAMLAKIAERTPVSETALIEVLRNIVRAMTQLCDWVAACAAGAGDSGRHLQAAYTEAAIARERLPALTRAHFREAATRCLDCLAAVSTVADVGQAARCAVAIPVPPFLDEVELIRTAPGSASSAAALEDEGPRGPFAIRAMLTLDGKPWANSQRLQPGIFYSIELVVTVPIWPKGTDRLVIDFVTTLPSELYRANHFMLEKPDDGVAELTAKGHVEFRSAQSLLSDPVLLQLRANFRSSADEKLVTGATIIGYHKLRARIADPRQMTVLSKYRALDLRIVDIVEDVRNLPCLDEQHLQDFVTTLAAVANYMGICAQSAVYRAGEKIPEAEFQKRLLIHLRGQLGEEVIEAPKQAAGITDIKFRSVTIELKVEESVADRAQMLVGYENQPTQYASGTGAQLGILCVLDLTEKDAPPAPTQNNLVVLTPKLHGFPAGNAPSPTRIVGVIIDGNLRSPSSYSR